MLGSVVDELAVSDVIMRCYCSLRRCARDYCQIIPLQRNIRVHARSYCAAKSCLQYDSAQIKEQEIRRQRKADGAGLNRPDGLLLVVDSHQHANKFTRDLTMMFI